MVIRIYFNNKFIYIDCLFHGRRQYRSSPGLTISPFSQIVSPPLHHFSALSKIFRPVISSSDFISLLMCQLLASRKISNSIKVQAAAKTIRSKFERTNSNQDINGLLYILCLCYIQDSTYGIPDLSIKFASKVLDSMCRVLLSFKRGYDQSLN